MPIIDRTDEPLHIEHIIPPRTLAILTELIQRVLASGFGEIHIIIKNGRIAFVTEVRSYNAEKEITE